MGAIQSAPGGTRREDVPQPGASPLGAGCSSVPQQGALVTCVHGLRRGTRRACPMAGLEVAEADSCVQFQRGEGAPVECGRQAPGEGRVAATRLVWAGDTSVNGTPATRMRDDGAHVSSLSGHLPGRAGVCLPGSHNGKGLRDCNKGCCSSCQRDFEGEGYDGGC